jgi:hypothetical protein
MARAAPKMKKTEFTSKLELSLRMTRKVPLLEHSLYDTENWTLWKVDQKYLEVLKCGAAEG